MKLGGVLELPPANVPLKAPNQQFSSDHIAIMAQFVLK
jgi:hypothetical protein